MRRGAATPCASLSSCITASPPSGLNSTARNWTHTASAESTGASVTDSFMEPVVGLPSLLLPLLPPPQAAISAVASATGRYRVTI